MGNKNKKHYSTSEVAAILGVSRIEIFRRIKAGKIKAGKVGRNYIVPAVELSGILGTSLTKQGKKEIDEAVKKTVEQYGETLKKLGNE